MVTMTRRATLISLFSGSATIAQSASGIMIDGQFYETSSPTRRSDLDGAFDHTEEDAYVGRGYDADPGPKSDQLALQQQSPVGRHVIAWSGADAPGTIHVSTADKRLRLVLPDHQALEYGIGVGRDGFSWKGTERISRKAQWPGWTPPAQMLERRPDLPRHMEGGINNPLGARALYLGSSLYRIHGTNEPHTIGHAVSSGCIRMANPDVMDLYERVSVGAQVIVR